MVNMKYLLIFLLLSAKIFAAAPSVGWFGFDGTHYYPSYGYLLKGYATNTLGVFNGSTDRPVVVSGGAPTYGLMIVRGGGATGSSTVAPNSEGYSYTSNTTGTQTLTFTTPFQDTPICICAIAATNTLFCGYNILLSSTLVEFVTYNTSGTATNAGYSWICIGQRNTAN
jgi:hypothetical protein